MPHGVVSLHEISAWLGHTDIKTTSIYLRITQASLPQAADRLERFHEEQERQKKQEEKKAKRPRRRPPTPSRPSGGASYTIN